MDNGDDRRQQYRPAKEHAMELAKAIHRDDSKVKREKKECGGGGVGVGNNNAPGFAADDETILNRAAWARAHLLPQWQ